MGTYVIRTPDIGEGIAQVELVAWHVKPGDTVQEDQVLADVMTDKATVEVPSPVAGTVQELLGEVGQQIAVGAELIRLEVVGAGNVANAVPLTEGSEVERSETQRSEVQHSEAQGSKAQRSAAQRPHPNPPPEGEGEKSDTSAGHGQHSLPPWGRAGVGAPPSKPPDANISTVTPTDKPLASPAVRQRARELGIALQFVHGSGPAGRITHQDLDVYLAARGQPSATRAAYAQREGETAVPVTGLRRRIAQRMQDAKRRIPHFSYVEEVDVTELEVLRKQLNDRHAAQRGKLTLLPLIARALVLAVRDFPQMNARFDDEAGVVTQYSAVHLGIATQTPHGLMVPVVHHAEGMDLWTCAQEIARLAEAARAGKALRADLMGSTITITSLGPLGGIVTTPVINTPEVAIVGVNRIVERPVMRQGAVVGRQMMNLSSSFDHRVIDGQQAAEFIQAVRTLLESPALLFVE